MKKNKKIINPKLSEGDRVILIYMGNEQQPIHSNQKGTVYGLTDFGDEIIYYVNWDDGRKLNLISTVDKWIKDDSNDSEINERIFLKKKDITENSLKLHDELYNRKEILKYYDVNKLRQFLSNLREISVVNMFESGFYLVCGKERLKHELKYKKVSSKKALKYIIDNAESVKSLMIRGTMELLKSQGKEVTPETVQRLMLRNANQIVMLYMLLPIKDAELDDETEDEDNYAEDNDEDENY